MTYTYDPNGNLLQKSTLGGAEFYEYNGFNQLVVLKQGEGGAAYGYNASGIRVSKQVGNTYTYFLLDGGDVVAECEDGSLSAIYTRGFNFVCRLTMDGMEFYLHDAHGDTVALTDGFGAVTKRYSYDAFGNEENPDDSDTNPFRYCGEYFDKETKTYYLRARYYDPAVGRFTQQDTHWSPANMIYGDNPRKIYERQDALGLSTCTCAPEISAIMQSGNLYVYCINSPVMYSDFSGNFALSTAALLAIGGFIIFGTIGGLIGNYYAEENDATGWERVGYIATGAIYLGCAGALCGYYLAPAVVAATGVSGISVTAAGINVLGVFGTLGSTVCNSWQEAEQLIRDTYGAVKHTFLLPGMSSRIVDGYNAAKGIIYEVKYGYTSLSNFVQTEIARDALLKSSGQVNAVEWHFFVSQVTGNGGASAPLLKALADAGIKVVFH